MGNRLEASYAGIPLINPFLIASGPPSDYPDMVERAFKAGWAGAVVKTVGTARPVNYEARPLLALYKSGKKTIGMGNVSVLHHTGMLEWKDAIRRLKIDFPDQVVIGSIAAAIIKEDWQSMAQQAEEAGFPAIELDMSCSHSRLSNHDGPIFIAGEDPEIVQDVIEWVRKVTSLPVVPKLPYSVRDWERMNRMCREAGAAGIAAINSVSGIISINIDTFEPQPSINGLSAYSGYTGPGIKPLALKAISKLAQGGPLPLSATGGVTTWRDAVEFVLVGASSVQVCTEVMLSGFKCVKPMLRGFLAYLEEKQLNLSDLVGRANEHLATSVFQIPPNLDLVAQIANERCIKCGLCVISCWDGGHRVISEAKPDYPKVDLSICTGCGLCTLVCPADAIEMVKKK
jgi:dihydropyrimidine dehydrogenase (NAD+) subunit PreA